THTVSFSAADLVSIKIVASGTPASTAVFYVLGGLAGHRGTGTANVVTKWDSTGVDITDSSRTDDGTTVFETLPEDWLVKTAPSTPASTHAAVYVDSTSKNLAVKDDAGVVKHGVQSLGAVSGQCVTSISDAGVASTGPCSGGLTIHSAVRVATTAN